METKEKCEKLDEGVNKKKKAFNQMVIYLFIYF